MNERNSPAPILPPIVAGMLLALATMEVSDSVVLSPFKELFPPQALVLVAVAIAAAIVGLMNTFVSRSKDGPPKKLNAFRKGVHHV